MDFREEKQISGRGDLHNVDDGSGKLVGCYSWQMGILKS